MLGSALASALELRSSRAPAKEEAEQQPKAKEHAEQPEKGTDVDAGLANESFETKAAAAVEQEAALSETRPGKGKKKPKATGQDGGDHDLVRSDVVSPLSRETDGVLNQAEVFKIWLQFGGGDKAKVLEKKKDLINDILKVANDCADAGAYPQERRLRTGLEDVIRSVDEWLGDGFG